MFDSKSIDFPIDCRKTKTKVKSQNTFRGNRELEVKTTKLLKVREKAGHQVVIGFSFASDLLEGWTNHRAKGSKTNVIPDDFRHSVENGSEPLVIDSGKKT